MSETTTQPELTQTQHHQKLIDLAFAVVRSTSWYEGESWARVHKDTFNQLFDYLHTECPKPRSPQILIETAGGVITDIYASKGFKDLDVTVRDLDDIFGGCTDPLEDHKDAEDMYTAAGYPEVVY